MPANSQTSIVLVRLLIPAATAILFSANLARIGCRKFAGARVLWDDYLTILGSVLLGISLYRVQVQTQVSFIADEETVRAKIFEGSTFGFAFSHTIVGVYKLSILSFLARRLRSDQKLPAFLHGALGVQIALVVNGTFTLIIALGDNRTREYLAIQLLHRCALGTNTLVCLSVLALLVWKAPVLARTSGYSVYAMVIFAFGFSLVSLGRTIMHQTSTVRYNKEWACKAYDLFILEAMLGILCSCIPIWRPLYRLRLYHGQPQDSSEPDSSPSFENHSSPIFEVSDSNQVHELSGGEYVALIEVDGTPSGRFELEGNKTMHTKSELRPGIPELAG